VDRLDDRVQRGRQEPVDEVRAGDGFRLGAAGPPRGVSARCKVKNFTDSAFRA
jgi:hypothetical protein